MSAEDLTDMGGARESFLTTDWSLIADIQGKQDQDRSLIGLLMQRYWKPVYCYLRRKGYANEEAKDLTQAFFHEIVLNRRLVERADPAKGRFRSFLLHALDQFLIDQKRKASARKRVPKDKLVPLDVADLPDLPAMILDRSPEDCFAYAWKSELLDRTLAQLEADCERRGLLTHWCIFRDNVLLPTLGEKEPEPMKAVAARYGIDSESTAFNMLLTVKRRYKAALRTNLRSTVAAEEDVDEEMREILSLVSEGEQNRR